MTDALEPTKKYVYVKNGTFHRDFEGLYSDVDDPWKAEADPHGSFFRKKERLAEAILVDTVSSYLEIGCGRGIWLDRLKASSNSNIIFSGADISAVAIDAATQRSPGISFDVLDIRYEIPRSTHQVACLDSMLWYVMEDIDATLRNIFHRVDACWVVQFFWKDNEQQKYGRDIFHGQDGFTSKLRADGYDVYRDERIDIPDDPCFYLGFICFRTLQVPRNCS